MNDTKITIQIDPKKDRLNVLKTKGTKNLTKAEVDELLDLLLSLLIQ